MKQKKEIILLDQLTELEKKSCFDLQDEFIKELSDFYYLNHYTNMFYGVGFLISRVNLEAISWSDIIGNQDRPFVTQKLLEYRIELLSRNDHFIPFYLEYLFQFSRMYSKSVYRKIRIEEYEKILKPVSELIENLDIKIQLVLASSFVPPKEGIVYRNEKPWFRLIHYFENLLKDYLGDYQYEKAWIIVDLMKKFLLIGNSYTVSEYFWKTGQTQLGIQYLKECVQESEKNQLECSLLKNGLSFLIRAEESKRKYKPRPRNNKSTETISVIKFKKI